jgi:hypothetical protein
LHFDAEVAGHVLMLKHSRANDSKLQLQNFYMFKRLLLQQELSQDPQVLSSAFSTGKLAYISQHQMSESG